MKTVDTVAFILIKDGRVLVERRKMDRTNDPGTVVIPGGHVEPGETHHDALKRELREELRLDGTGFRFFERMLCESNTENQMNHWYICVAWNGTPVASEAVQVFYIGRDEVDLLSLPNDRAVITRLFHDLFD